MLRRAEDWISRRAGVGLGWGTFLGILAAIFKAAWLISGKEVGMGYIVVITAMLLGLLVVICGSYIVYKKPDDPNTDSNPMSLAMRRIILAYFLLLGGLLVALLIDLNMMDFPQTTVSIPLPTPTPTPQKTTPSGTSAPSAIPTPSPTPSNGAAGTADEPVLQQVLPRITAGTAPVNYLDVFGSNLENGQIRINGQERPTKSIGPNLLETLPDPSDVQGKGSLTIDVIIKSNPVKISNCIIVPIDVPTAHLRLGWWDPCITREVQLLLIVIIAGALGSLIHSLNSITVFIGNRTAVASWFWWYITRPLFGMALTLIFYAVLRGGFLAGSPADAKAINPFGVLAIGALVGMFTQKAMGKLADIFDIVFHSKADEQSKDKTKKISIKTASLPAFTSGQAYSAQLEALDASPSLTWDVTGLPAGLSCDPKTGLINTTPGGTITAARGTATTIRVVANDGPGNSDTKTFNMTVQ